MSDNQWIIEDLDKKWQGNKKYTMEVLEAMPEEAYDFEPAPDTMSFRKQAIHTGKAFSYHLSKAGHPGLSRVDETDKSSIIASYNLIFDEILAYLNQIEASSLQEQTSLWYGPSSYNRILTLMDNHLAHHRGQMILYLRMKGIAAPSYVGW